MDLGYNNLTDEFENLDDKYSITIYFNTQEEKNKFLEFMQTYQPDSDNNKQ